MFSSLSDRTKSFIAAAAVLVVAVCNIVFGMDWVAERPAARPIAAVTAMPEPVAARTGGLTTPAPPAAAGGLPINRNAAAPPDNRATPSNSAAQMYNPTVLAPEVAPPKCDIVACAEAYRSFQQSDCTFQPNVGPRRLCTKGTPPQ